MATSRGPVNSPVAAPEAAGQAPAEVRAAAPDGVEIRLREEPFCFQFFQAVRLLEQCLAPRKPVGRFVNPDQEVVRFSVNNSLTFPASDIQSLEFPDAESAAMTVNFGGLTGPHGVLPHWYTVYIRERIRAGDRTIPAFFDIFNHRFVSLLFRAWEKYRFTISYERGERGGFTQNLLDLIGLGTKGLADRQSVVDDSLIFYAGLLGQRPRSAAALAQIISDYFGVPVEVQQFLGSWYRLDDVTQCRLEDPLDSSEQVGLGAIVGEEVWDPHAKVRIKLGPLTLEQYLDFLPNGTAFEPLRAITSFFSNEEFDFEVQLVLKQDEVPTCELGADGDAAPQLGWVTWVRSVPIDRNPQDTILQL
jgi:type VI secretion system protein ImpH